MLNKIYSAFKDLPVYLGLDVPGETAVNSAAAARRLVEESTSGAQPLSNYLSYRYYDSEHDLFFNDQTIGFMLQIAPIVGVDTGLLKNLRYFFNDEIPANCFLQFLLVASHDTEPIVRKWRDARSNQHPILQKLTNKRSEFIEQMSTNFANFDGRIARDYKVYINFSQKLERSASNIAKIQAFKDQLSKKLTTLSLSPRVCRAEELIELVREILQMQITKPEIEKLRKTTYDPLNLLSQQILPPLQRQEVTDQSIIHIDSGLTTKGYYAKELPKEFSLGQMIGMLGSSENALFGIPARFIISYTVASDLNTAAQGGLTAKGDRAIHAAQQWYSRNDKDINREAKEWSEINDRIKNGERFLTEHFNVVITAAHKEIEAAEQALISLYNVLDFRLKINRNLQLISLLSALPMQQGIYWQALKNFKLTRTCVSEEVIARLPMHSEWYGVPLPGILLHARRGQLFNWNPFYRLSGGNYNVSIFGPSGGGKSVFLQESVISLVSQATRVFVLDIGQSFVNICRLLDGEMIQFGKEVNLALNPFASFSADMSQDDHDEFLKCAKELLSIMCGVKDDPYGSAELEKAIIRALQDTGYNLDITKFAQILEASNAPILQRYGATLYSYTKEGLYGKYFMGKESASFKKLMTVFEFEEIKNNPALLAIILQILLMEITKQFLTGDRTKQFMIIVDEAWMLLDFAASFFAAFGRTVRKYGGSLVICVQNFMDLQKTVDHKAILENSTWTIMLKQDEKGLEAFKNSEAFKDMVPLIQSVSLAPGKYSEVLLYSTGIKVVGRLVLDDYSKVLYSTDAKDFSYINTRVKEGANLDQAIEDLAALKYAPVPQKIGNHA